MENWGFAPSCAAVLSMSELLCCCQHMCMQGVCAVCLLAWSRYFLELLRSANFGIILVSIISFDCHMSILVDLAHDAGVRHKSD